MLLAIACRLQLLLVGAKSGGDVVISFTFQLPHSGEHLETREVSKQFADFIYTQEIK
jgi:hypothetical protein